MTEPKEDKFTATIKQNAKSTQKIVSWALNIPKGGSSPYVPLTRNKQWVPESVVLDAYAQSQHQRNQQLQQLLKEFPESADKYLRDGSHDWYAYAIDVWKWKQRLEAFLKATETEAETK